MHLVETNSSARETSSTEEISVIDCAGRTDSVTTPVDDVVNSVYILHRSRRRRDDVPHLRPWTGINASAMAKWLNRRNVYLCVCVCGDSINTKIKSVNNCGN